MTTTTNHPWAKYYASRGVNRPQMAELPGHRASAPARRSATSARGTKAGSNDVAVGDAVVNATADTGAAAMPTSFSTAAQKARTAREISRAQNIRLARLAAIGALAAMLLHVAVTQVFHRAPSRVAVQTHADQLKADLFPLYSTARQPLQIDNVVVSAPERLDGDRLRYVAAVTFRLRRPLYAPAPVNTTAVRVQLQANLQAAREQALRYSLFSEVGAPDAPTLPMLLEASHRAGEAMTITVPFTARRFGWSWKLDAPRTELRRASREFEGESIESYAAERFLVYSPETLAELRARMRAAQAYVAAVTDAVNFREADRANAELLPSLATEVARESGPQDQPAFDPNAPAIVDPNAPAVELPAAADTVARAAWGPRTEQR